MNDGDRRPQRIRNVYPRSVLLGREAGQAWGWGSLLAVLVAVLFFGGCQSLSTGTGTVELRPLPSGCRPRSVAGDSQLQQFRLPELEWRSEGGRQVAEVEGIDGWLVAAQTSAVALSLEDAAGRDIPARECGLFSIGSGQTYRLVTEVQPLGGDAGDATAHFRAEGRLR